MAGSSSSPLQLQVINITLEGAYQGLRGPAGPGQSSSAQVDLWGCLVVGAALVTAGDPKLIWRDGKLLDPYSNVSGSTKLQAVTLEFSKVPEWE